MNFIANITSFGALTEKINGYKRPDMALAFVKNYLEQIKLLEAGATYSKKTCFKKQANGSYIVWLKNGIRFLPIVGKSNEMICADKEKAIEYMQGAIAAAKAGELNELLELSKTPDRVQNDDEALMTA